MAYRVDNIPLPLKLPFLLYGYGLGVLLFLLVRLISLTVRVQVEGIEHLAPNQSYIFAMWHTDNIPAFVTSFFKRTQRRFVLLNHPLWYMKPVHVLLHLLGVEKLVLGSSGNGGREAARTIVEYLKQGISTHINPDGPTGPSKTLKKGVLHLGAQSNVPVVPVRFSCSNQWVLKNTWDPKRIPLPFTDITIKYGSPIYITPEGLKQSSETLQKLL